MSDFGLVFQIQGRSVLPTKFTDRMTLIGPETFIPKFNALKSDSEKMAAMEGSQEFKNFKFAVGALRLDPNVEELLKNPKFEMRFQIQNAGPNAPTYLGSKRPDGSYLVVLSPTQSKSVLLMTQNISYHVSRYRQDLEATPNLPFDPSVRGMNLAERESQQRLSAISKILLTSPIAAERKLGNDLRGMRQQIAELRLP